MYDNTTQQSLTQRMATNSRNNYKRLKTLIPNSPIFTLNEENDELESEGQEENRSATMERSGEWLSCGICLCENRNAIRGQIDSCDHFFCFVCILEWAKVESRCPMCKRRFTTIRRPPKHGVFPSERLVHVSRRDQVYCLSGNTTIVPFDPYAQVQCSVCHTAADESILLLCDLCDSAAHTYCVGLGFTVPEGDWFCHDCSVSRTEHEIIQKDDFDDDMAENLNMKSKVVLAAEPCVSSFENTSENYHVRVNACESDNKFIGRPRARLSRVSSPCEGQLNLANDMSQPTEETCQTRPGQQTYQSDARTLSRCRNVHSYVRALRENWDALRSGSLRFSSNSVESSSSSSRSNKKCNTLAVTHRDISDQSHTTSTSDEQQTTNDGLPGISAQGRHSHDAKKAWKMMAKAKSIQRRTISVQCVSENPSAIGYAARKATGGSCSLHIPRSQQLGTSGLVNFTSEKPYKHYSPEKHTFSKCKMQSHSMTLTKEIMGSSDNLPTSSGFFESISSWQVQSISQSNVSLENQELILQQNQCRALLRVNNQQNGSSLSKPSVGSVSATSRSLNTKANFRASFSCKVNKPEGDVRSEKDRMKSKARNDDSAKSEIQSLVKLNLKLLKGDKQLGVDAFKEVARLATHTILAACGFEHSRHVFHSFPRFVCSHSECIQQLRKSTLMPNSCRECFYGFVKDVVNSVLSEKVSHDNSSKLLS